MATEPYDDLGGLARGGPYDANGAITRHCTDCGAAPGEKCTFAFQVNRPGTGLVTEHKTRHMPCKSRLTHTETT